MYKYLTFNILFCRDYDLSLAFLRNKLSAFYYLSSLKIITMGLKAFYEVLHTPSPRGKFRCNLCNGGQNLPTHPGWDRVKVSEKLAAISVALVAPVDTSLTDSIKLEFSCLYDFTRYLPSQNLNPSVCEKF